MFKKISFILFSILVAQSSWGFELTQVTGTQTSIAYAGTADNSVGNNQYLLAESVVAPESITGYIPFNKKVGILTFSILAPKKSIIIMKWDNSDSLYSRIGEMLKFRRAGEYQSISFNATKLTSGYISLYNTDNKLLKRIHYVIKKQRSYSQNLRAYVRDSSSVDANSNSGNLGVGYSISQRVDIGEPSFSFGLSVSSDLNNSANRTTTASVGYSW